MRLLRYALILLLTFVPLVLAILLWLTLSVTPLVADRGALNHEDLARIKTLIRLNDPRRFRAGAEQRMRINEPDLNLVAKYVLSQYGQGAAQIQVQDRKLAAATSLRLPRPGARLYLNIRLQLVETGQGTAVSRLQVGRITVPDPVTQWLLNQALQQLRSNEELSLLVEALHQVRFEPGWIHLRFDWDPRMLDPVRGQFLSGVDRAAVADYYAYLVELQALGIGTRGSLVEVLTPLFEHARDRSAQGDPVRENRALLAMLAAWAGGSGLEGLLEEPATAHQPFNMTLRKRLDLGQHLLISAALAAAGNAELSNTIGLYKEMADTTQGSGFSFTDLAADRAGVRFGELATASVANARRVQELLGSGLQDADIMPPMRGLPEGLRSAEFTRRYGQVDSSAFTAQLQEIDRRIATCRLYAAAATP